MSVQQLLTSSSYTGTTVKFSITSPIPVVTSWTGMCWAYMTSANNADLYRDLIACTDTGDVIGLGVKLASGSNYNINLGDLNTDNVGTRVVTGNEWHHYAMTVCSNGANTQCYGWLDGELEVNKVALVAPVQANTLFQIWNSRASTTDAGSQWVGTACAWKIWDTPLLDVDDVRREMKCFQAVRKRGLWACTPMFDTGSKAINVGGRVGKDWTFAGTVTESNLYPPGVVWDYPLAKRFVGHFYRPPQSINVTAADAPSTSDAVTGIAVKSRTASDSPSTADSVARVILEVRTTADAPSAADSVSRLLLATRTSTDSPIVAESAARLLTVLRTTIDAPSTTDGVARLSVATRTNSDSPVTSETAARLLLGVRTTSDSPSVSDSVSGSGGLAQMIICGFDTGDAQECQTTSGTFSFQSGVTVGAWSTYALRTNPTTTSTGFVRLSGTDAGGAASAAAFNAPTLYVRFYFRADVLPATNFEPILRVRRTDLGDKVYLYVNSAGKIDVYSATNVLIASGGITLTSGTWYRVEFKVGTGAGGGLETKIDGVVDVSTTATLSTSTNSAVDLGKWVNRNGNSVDFYFDDVVISDASYPGNSRVTLLVPNANGTYQTATIGAGSGSHFQVVDAIPPAGDTSYLVTDATVGHAETEAMTDTATASITGVINAAKSLAVLKRDGASNGSVLLRTRVGGTDSDNSSAFASTNAYTLSSRSMTVNPVTAAAWTTSDIDGVEVGVVEQSANKSRLTFVGLAVVYTATASYNVTASDSPSVASAPVRSLSGFRTVTDTPSTSDSASRALVKLVSANDAPTSSQTLTRVTVDVRAAADAPSTLSAVSRLFAGTRTLTDGPSSLDAPTRLWVGTRTAADGPVVAELSSRLWVGTRTAADAPSTASSLIGFKGKSIVASDAPHVSEVAARISSASKTLADSPVVADALSTVGTHPRTLSDAPHVVDAAARQWVGTRSSVDSPAVLEGAVRQLHESRTTADAPHVTDVAIGTAPSARTAADAAHVADALVAFKGFALLLGDAPAVSEVVIATTGHGAVTPIRHLRAVGRVDTLLSASGRLDVVFAAPGRVDTTFVAVGRSDVAAEVDLGCEYGEDVEVDWFLVTGEDISGWTITAELLASAGVLTPVASGVFTPNDATTGKIVFSSADTADRTITHWRVCRTDTGDKTVLTKGRWSIKNERVSGVS